MAHGDLLRGITSNMLILIMMIQHGKPWTCLHRREHTMTMLDYQALFQAGHPKDIQIMQGMPGID